MVFKPKKKVEKVVAPEPEEQEYEDEYDEEEVEEEEEEEEEPVVETPKVKKVTPEKQITPQEVVDVIEGHLSRAHQLLQLLK